MTDDEIGKLLAEATPGPWRASVHQGVADVDRGKVWASRPGSVMYERCILSGNKYYPDCVPDSRRAAAAPYLAEEVLRLRALIWSGAAGVGGGGNMSQPPGVAIAGPVRTGK